MSRRRLMARLTVAIGIVAGIIIGVLLLTAGSAGHRRHPSYVALGDSYTAGDGTGDYYNDGSRCFRSPEAYPPLVAARRHYALTFAACSGATTGSVIAEQLSSLKASTKVVTIQVGGNDVDFLRVIGDCVLHADTCQNEIYALASAITSTLPAALNQLYDDIQADAPRAKVVVLGYPHLFSSGGGTCSPYLLSPPAEQAFNEALDLLDGTLAREAASHGFKFVDPRAAFTGHELCSPAPWINNAMTPLVRSYHPNAAGEAQFAKLIEAAL